MLYKYTKSNRNVKVSNFLLPQPPYKSAIYQKGVIFLYFFSEKHLSKQIISLSLPSANDRTRLTSEIDKQKKL